MTTGNFRYLDPATLGGANSKPWTKVDTDVTSFSRTERRRSVANIRDAGEDFGTDVSGFAVYNAPATEKDFTEDAAVRGGYYPEVEAVLRAKLPGVKKVVIFDHTIRRRVKDSPRQPVQQVHVDQTPAAAEVRVRRHVPGDEAEELLKGRYQIINVWRPIGHPASDFPLAVIDWRTTGPKDLVAVDLLYPKRTDADDDDDRGKEVLPDPSLAQSTEGYEVKGEFRDPDPPRHRAFFSARWDFLLTMFPGETFSVAPSDKHKFYYAKDMTPDEVMFIKCFDSRSQGRPGGKPGVADYTPHTAFVDPNTPADAKGRQSIEVRCLVFYD
ncbi:putative methyltransferase [Colletotrichum sublineola]|uniref:Putative methyltransferase n=1 Tax=Colletotrichum sublineola TaxID=1173701 RepID=A0A066X5I2_COLSU|nr:putative methyltransferase [Colletotrichum sublineola]